MQPSIWQSLSESGRGCRGCGRSTETSVKREFIASDWFCIATGPSLTEKDARTAQETAIRVNGRVIVVNDAFRLLPDADILYACDPGWWRVHIESVREAFSGFLCTQWHFSGSRGNTVGDKEAIQEGLFAVHGVREIGLGLDKLHFNNNSGSQAINLAYLLGAERIYLLGYDMGWHGGKAHFFGDHPKKLTNADPTKFIATYDKLAADLKQTGVQVLNLSRSTKLTQFPRATIDDYPGFCRYQQAL